MDIDKKELQEIKSLERELIQDQQIEIGIKSSNGNNPIQKIINAYIVKRSLYDDPEQIEILMNKLKKELKLIITKNGIRGKLLGEKAINKYFEKQEMADLARKKIRIIKLANEKSVKRRLDIFFLEMEKEKNILKADIDIFKANAKMAGFTDKEIFAQLIQAGKDKEGFVQQFSNRVKSVTVAAERREKAAQEIDQYRLITPEDQKWQWITISSKPCPDCEPRAGKVMYLYEWERIGLPGEGRTICGKFCRCKLFPEPVAQEKFQTVKVFDFDKNNLVLTTASEARILNAQKNQPIQKEK